MDNFRIIPNEVDQNEHFRILGKEVEQEPDPGFWGNLVEGGLEKTMNEGTEYQQTLLGLRDSGLL